MLAAMNSFIVPPPPLTLPTYDNLGTTGAGTASSFTEPITIGSTATAIVVWVTTNNVVTTGVTYNGLTLKRLTGVSSFANIWGLAQATPINPGGGAQNYVVTLASTGFTSVGAASYNNATSFGKPAIATGSGAAASISVPSTARQRVVAAFICLATSGGAAFAAPSGSPNTPTSRGNYPFNSGVNYPAMACDVVGASTQTISSTMPSSAWTAIAVPIN